MSTPTLRRAGALLVASQRPRLVGLHAVDPGLPRGGEHVADPLALVGPARDRARRRRTRGRRDGRRPRARVPSPPATGRAARARSAAPANASTIRARQSKRCARGRHRSGRCARRPGRARGHQDRLALVAVGPERAVLVVGHPPLPAVAAAVVGIDRAEPAAGVDPALGQDPRARPIRRRAGTGTRTGRSPRRSRARSSTRPTGRWHRASARAVVIPIGANSRSRRNAAYASPRPTTSATIPEMTLVVPLE